MVLNDNSKHCFYCERPFNDDHYGTNRSCVKTRDHIIPVSENGTNHRINMVYACSECNRFKANLSLEYFIEKVYLRVSKKLTYKEIPSKLLPVIIYNAKRLIPYVKEKGDALYKKPPNADHVKSKSFYYFEKPHLPVSEFPTIAQINKEVKKRKKKYKVEKLAADCHLSVNGNTPRREPDKEYDLFLQHQTSEQFHLAKKHGWRIAKLLTDPDPNFHIV